MRIQALTWLCQYRITLKHMSRVIATNCNECIDLSLIALSPLECYFFYVRWYDNEISIRGGMITFPSLFERQYNVIARVKASKVIEKG